MVSNSEIHKIRPSTRIINTIGEDLIKDNFAAIIELVKNAYDADAKEVKIQFSTITDIKNNAFIKIDIDDNGHGMTLETVINKWMVPATSDKYMRKVSPGGRTLQGRKGIGRYAVGLLGNKLKMSTVDQENNETIVEIDWNEFTKKQYLEDVGILVKSNKVKKSCGTHIEIIGDREKLFEWTNECVEQLINELQKMLSPIKKQELMLKENEENKDKFDIKLIFEDFITLEEYENCCIDIEPLDLINLFDYQLQGKIGNDGKFDLTFINNIGSTPQVEIIQKSYTVEPGFNVGDIRIDFRVFDRDPDAIQNIINRGLINDNGREMGKREAREHLDQMCGIGIYRGGFKVRPYGDAGYDWLELDKSRVQAPSRKIGSNQVIGFVEIGSEEESNLKEKSARDGLKENGYYLSFKKLLKEAINELEIRRFEIRKSIGRGRSKGELNKQINELFNFTSLSQKIEDTLKGTNISDEKMEDIKQHIHQLEEEKSKQLKKIEEIIAIYQGQATLGRIMMIFMHEGRKPLNWINTQSENMKFFIEKYVKSMNQDLLNKIIKNIEKNKEYTQQLARLFDRMEPLAKNKRTKKGIFNINEAIEESIQIFQAHLIENKIELKTNCKKELQYVGWKMDIIIILSNLLENSIYWIKESKRENAEIEITVHGNEELEYIEYKDNGPGIKKEHIESKVIFEPEFSTKSGSKGTGLGLAIAGEASERNGMELKAIYNSKGANFRIEVKKDEEINDAEI